MKPSNYLILALFTGLVLVTMSCKKDDDMVNPSHPQNPSTPPEEPTEQPPVAIFSLQSGSAVVNESFKFTNTSSGDITSYSWNFGNDEGTSLAKNPTYKFKKLGNKNVSLTVTGPNGSDTFTKTLTVYAMPPDCHNYNSHYNMNEGTILNLRNQGVLEYGKLVILNDYGNEVKIELYHSDDWLSENYYPWGTRYWTVPYNLPNGNTLITSEGYFNIGGDWGIRVTFGNGAKSCIRTIHYYSKSFTHNNIKYLKVYASDIYEGSYSWNKSIKNHPDISKVPMTCINNK